MDTLGLVLKVMVSEADMPERTGAKHLLLRVAGCFRRLRLVWMDGGYRGDWIAWAQDRLRFTIQIVARDPTVKGFKLLPRRWVVERTFAWLGNCRRLSKDYEYRPASSEAMIYLALIRLMVRRLTASS